MAATTKLIVYNDTLREIGGSPLADIVTTNTKLTELNGAFNHAVEYLLSKVDWNFAKRRASLTGVSDTSFTPYTYRYARPSDYLRKVWIKTAADDEFQIPHTESGAVIYGFETAAKMEYISDHADNYDPANWPPQFTRCMVLYLALLVGPKLARTGDNEAKSWNDKLSAALSEAETQEAVFAINAQISTERNTTMRRAIEILGQQLAGSVSINNRIDQLRWSMNKAWTHTVRYVLSEGAWNFATKRALFKNGEAGDANVPSDTIDGIIEGYSVGPTDEDDPIPVSGYDYGYPLPDDFLHKIWIKGDVSHDRECDHQTMGQYIFTNTDPAIMEYIAENSDTTDPDNWPPTFLDAIAAHLALTVAPEFVIEETGRGKARITQNSVRDRLQEVYFNKLSDARMKDAIQQQVKTIPLGRFARARFGAHAGSGFYRLR